MKKSMTSLSMDIADGFPREKLSYLQEKYPLELFLVLIILYSFI